MSTRRAAALIGILGVFILGGGYLAVHGLSAGAIIPEMYANFGAEFLSIALTVLVIDYLNQRRQELDLKRELVRDLGSSESVFVQRAIRELGAHETRGTSWLRNGTLDGASLSGADLAGVDLPHARLRESDLSLARLSGAFLSGADLAGARLSFCDLTDADLQFCVLDGADLSDAVLRGADLRGASLRDARLDGAVLEDVHFDETTHWPAGWDPARLV